MDSRARRFAELIVRDNRKDGRFEIKLLGIEEWQEAVIAALCDMGCEVSVSDGTLTVQCPENARFQS